MDPIIDWQISRHEIKARGQYLLETAKWADCHFLVGGGQLLAGHKLILAMASPVFEAMFFGGLPEKNDPIEISDVQPDAFKALLEYIYTDKININTVDKAFELCYAAKKYMLNFVVEQCTSFLWSDLCPKNVCRAYEFSKLFEEPRLTEKCLQIICTKTMDVITDSSFEDIELTTIITILEQDSLNVDNELSLFFAVNRYSDKHGLTSQNANDNDDQQSPSSSRSSNGSPPPQGPPQVELEAAGSSNNADQQQRQQPPPPPPPPNRIQEMPTIRDAVKKIRFLTLTPQQFAEGPARTNLLTQSEAFAILMNISTNNSHYPMPEGFTVNKNSRVTIDSRSPSPYPIHIPTQQPISPQVLAPVAQIIPLEHEAAPHNLTTAPQAGPSYSHFVRDRGDMGDRDRERERIDYENKYYCIRAIRGHKDVLNQSVLDCSLSFSVDRNGICIMGLQVPTQNLSSANQASSSIHVPNDIRRYSEIIYAHLLDSHGSRLTYTHVNQKVVYDSITEIMFNRPVYIQKNKIYKVGVVFNKPGWYQMSNCVPNVTSDNVTFTFGMPGVSVDTYRDGLIRGLIYTYSRD